VVTGVKALHFAMRWPTATLDPGHHRASSLVIGRTHQGREPNDLRCLTTGPSGTRICPRVHVSTGQSPRCTDRKLTCGNDAPEASA
jgi:hypothetical protein